MTLRTLKWLTVLLPPLLIGGFEYVRHEFLLQILSMEAGNVYITLLTLLLSFLFSTWVFRQIRQSNERLAAEEAKRAVYEERERLAQELHDNIAQILFFLNVQLKKGQIEEARSAVSEIDHHVRQAIFNLRTPPVEGANFASRLEAWLEEWSGLSGIAVERRIAADFSGISPAAEVQLFSIIREAFTNIRKHSQADHASIELGPSGDGWKLVIADNGIGLGEEHGTDAYRYGLSMMRRRVESLGGELAIRSGDEGGLKLTMTGGWKL